MEGGGKIELTLIYHSVTGAVILLSSVPTNSTYQILKLKLVPQDCKGTKKRNKSIRIHNVSKAGSDVPLCTASF